MKLDSHTADLIEPLLFAGIMLVIVVKGLMHRERKAKAVAEFDRLCAGIRDTVAWHACDDVLLKETLLKGLDWKWINRPVGNMVQADLGKGYKLQIDLTVPSGKASPFVDTLTLRVGEKTLRTATRNDFSNKPNLQGRI